MLILPQLCFNGFGVDIIAVSTSSNRPVKGSKSGASWQSLGSNFDQYLGAAGGAFGEAVSVGNEAFIVNSNGELYKTVDFRAFTRINIASIPRGNAPNFVFLTTLFKDPAYPNRLYASGLINGSQATAIWYSDDLGVNWVDTGISTAGSGVSITNWVIVGNYFYCGISVSGNSGVTLYRFNRFNFSDNQQVSNTAIINMPWLHVISDRLFTLNGPLRWTDNPLSGANSVTLPSGFEGSCMTQRNIGGSPRQVIIGRNNNTAQVAIIYSNNAPESTWQYANVPSIVVGSISTRYAKIIPLSKQEGFVASYVDTNDNTSSGILYSPDGINWTAANDNSLTEYVNIMVNPLAR